MIVRMAALLVLRLCGLARALPVTTSAEHCA
jgi:hypothetical protein